MRTVLHAVALAMALSPIVTAAMEPPNPNILRFDVSEFRPFEGPTTPELVYYRVVADPDGRALRSSYHPDQETVTMGVEIPKELRNRITHVRWRWRARIFPKDGDECHTLGVHSDSAASVFIAWKRGLRYYVLKYSWATRGRLGQVCDLKRNLLLARDTIILEAGGKPNTWLPELIDVRRSFRDHFAGGDPDASIPDLVGIALMTDGDQSHSDSSADYADFEVLY